MPGALKLLRYLKKLGLPIAIATSSSREYLDYKKENNPELFSLVDCIVCGDDPRLSHGKPAPDIFLLAASEIETNPRSSPAFFYSY